MLLAKLSDFPFHYELTTRWKDMDSFGHVNNAVFLTYIEDARITLFQRWKLNNRNKSMIMASVKLDYLRQIMHPVSLIVGQNIIRIGKTSFDLQAVLFMKNDPQPAASAVVSCVCFNYEQNMSVAVYPEIKADFELNKQDRKSTS